MSANEIMQQIDALPATEQQKLFVMFSKKVVGHASGEPKPWVKKNLSFDEACDLVFRENRELLGALAK